MDVISAPIVRVDVAFFSKDRPRRLVPDLDRAIHGTVRSSSTYDDHNLRGESAHVAFLGDPTRSSDARALTAVITMVRKDDTVTDAMRIEALPAGHGDCLLIEYGKPGTSRRILVDGGPARSYAGVAARLRELPPAKRRVELLVITHIDADHIEGAIKLLNDADLGLDVGEVWFNGYRHLPPDDLLGPAQGEMVSALLKRRGLAWNARFDGGPVSLEPHGALPRRRLPGGLVLTVLAPGEDELRALRRVWERECGRAGITPGSSREALDLLASSNRLNPLDAYLGAPDVGELARPRAEHDESAPNASSIVLLAEYRNRSVLLAGDATPDTLTAGLGRLLVERHRRVLDIDVFKLPHHGSRYNVTAEVLALVRAHTFLVSTDGKYFGHPDAAAIARVLIKAPSGGRIVFNYRTPTTVTWSMPSTLAPYGFEADIPADNGTQGAVVVL